MSTGRLLKALEVTAEIMNKQISADAIRTMAYHLSKFPEDLVIKAIMRCQVEVKFFPTVAEIVERIEDGRPGVEAAWAMVPKEQHQSVVWNEEIRSAYGSAYTLISEGDFIGARMAFKESYERIVNENRANGVPPKWSPSFGTEASGRAAAVIEAVERKRISISLAIAMLPEIESLATGHRLLSTPEARLALGSPEKVSIEGRKKVLALIGISEEDGRKL